MMIEGPLPFQRFFVFLTDVKNDQSQGTFLKVAWVYPYKVNCKPTEHFDVTVLGHLKISNPNLHGFKILKNCRSLETNKETLFLTIKIEPSMRRDCLLSLACEQAVRNFGLLRRLYLAFWIWISCSCCLLVQRFDLRIYR